MRTLAELQKLETTLVGPRPSKENWSAAAVVDGVVDDDSATALADLRHDLAECDVLLAVKGSLAASIDVKAIKLRQGELAKALTKAEKDLVASSATVGAASLALDRARYDQGRKPKREGAERGEAKARQTYAQLKTQQQRHLSGRTA